MLAPQIGWIDRIFDPNVDPIKHHFGGGDKFGIAYSCRGGFLDLWEAANALEHTSHAYEGSLFDAAGKPIPFSGIYRDEFLTQRGVQFLRTTSLERTT